MAEIRDVLLNAKNYLLNYDLKKVEEDIRENQPKEIDESKNRLSKWFTKNVTNGIRDDKLKKLEEKKTAILSRQKAFLDENKDYRFLSSDDDIRNQFQEVFKDDNGIRRSFFEALFDLDRTEYEYSEGQEEYLKLVIANTDEISAVRKGFYNAYGLVSGKTGLLEEPLDKIDDKKITELIAELLDNASVEHQLVFAGLEGEKDYKEDKELVSAYLKLDADTSDVMFAVKVYLGERLKAIKGQEGSSSFGEVFYKEVRSLLGAVNDDLFLNKEEKEMNKSKLHSFFRIEDYLISYLGL